MAKNKRYQFADDTFDTFERYAKLQGWDSYTRSVVIMLMKMGYLDGELAELRQNLADAEEKAGK